MSYTFADGGELSGYRDPFVVNVCADVSHRAFALLQSLGVQGPTGTSLGSSATNLSRRKRRGITLGNPAGAWEPTWFPSHR